MSATTAPPVVPASQIASKRRWAFQAPDSAIGRAQERLGWMLIAPSLLVVAVVAFYPLFETFRLSFTNERLGSVREVRYIGFENYRLLLEDELFRSAFWHTVQFTVASVAFETGEDLRFETEAVRARHDRLVLVQSQYRQPFGTFHGALPQVGPLRGGLGVMEHHRARW